MFVFTWRHSNYLETLQNVSIIRKYKTRKLTLELKKKRVTKRSLLLQRGALHLQVPAVSFPGSLVKLLRQWWNTFLFRKHIGYIGSIGIVIGQWWLLNSIAMHSWIMYHLKMKIHKYILFKIRGFQPVIFMKTIRRFVLKSTPLHEVRPLSKQIHEEYRKLWKTNISSEYQWLEDVIPIEIVPFLGDICSFSGV